MGLRTAAAATGAGLVLAACGTSERDHDNLRLGGRPVVTRGGRPVDVDTGSTWDVTGRSTAGPLRGAQLTPLLSDQQFWFALSAFAPEVRLVSR